MQSYIIWKDLSNIFDIIKVHHNLKYKEQMKISSLIIRPRNF